MRNILFILCFSITIISCEQNTIRPILPDGKIKDEEWSDAKVIAIDSENILYVKHDSFYYYLAVKSDLPKPLYVDLFIKIQNSIYNIHASAQLGDRVLTDTLWTDTSPITLWGQNQKWVANTVKFDRSKMRDLKENGFKDNIYKATHLPYDGIEFQFDKGKWNLKKAKFRIEIRSMIGPEGFKDKVFPSGSKRKSSEKWIPIF